MPLSLGRCGQPSAGWLVGQPIGGAGQRRAPSSRETPGQPRSRRRRCRAPGRGAGCARCRRPLRCCRRRDRSGRRSRATLDSPSTASSLSRAIPRSRAAVSSLRSAAGPQRPARELRGAARRRGRPPGRWAAKARRALPSALACTGSPGLDLRDLQRGAGAEDVVDDHDGRRVHHAHAHCGVGSLRQPLGVDDRARAQLVQVEVGVPQLEQAGAELVLVRVSARPDEAVRLERLEQAVDGGAGEVERSASSLTPRRRGPAASALRMRAERSTDWIVPRLVRGAALCCDSILSNPLR